MLVVLVLVIPVRLLVRLLLLRILPRFLFCFLFLVVDIPRGLAHVSISPRLCFKDSLSAPGV